MVFKKGNIPWMKGRSPWNKGLTKEKDERVRRIAEKHIGNSWSRGRRFSEEHKKKISEARKGHIAWNKGLTKETDERVAQIGIKQRNKNVSKETRRKMSRASKGRHLSEETKRKLSDARKRGKWWLGKHHSEETKRKMSEARNGLSSWNKGKRLSKDHKNKIGKAHEGNKSHNWRGGISFIPYPPIFNEDLKKKIKKRDNCACQICYVKRRLSIHHIDYDKANCSSDNLITLCTSCNSKVNFNRSYWMHYFQEVLEPFVLKAEEVKI